MAKNDKELAKQLMKKHRLKEEARDKLRKERREKKAVAEGFSWEEMEKHREELRVQHIEATNKIFADECAAKGITVEGGRENQRQRCWKRSVRPKASLSRNGKRKNARRWWNTNGSASLNRSSVTAMVCVVPMLVSYAENNARASYPLVLPAASGHLSIWRPSNCHGLHGIVHQNQTGRASHRAG